MFTQCNNNNMNEEVEDKIYCRPSNERLLPTTEETLGEKRFLYALWMYLQSVSKGSIINEYRYVNVKDVNCSTLAEKITLLSKVAGDKEYLNKKITRQTISKGMKYLIDQGFIVGIVDGNQVFEGYKGSYYKLKNRNAFKFFVYMENDFINKLISVLPQDAIKVYMVYYSFNRGDIEGECYLTQQQILQRVGLSASGQNHEKLTYINVILERFGLIEKYVEVYKKDGREVKRKNIIVAPLYWTTELYAKLQEEKQIKNNYMNYIVERIKVD